MGDDNLTRHQKHFLSCLTSLGREGSICTESVQIEALNEGVHGKPLCKLPRFWTPLGWFCHPFLMKYSVVIRNRNEEKARGWNWGH